MVYLPAVTTWKSRLRRRFYDQGLTRTYLWSPAPCKCQLLDAARGVPRDRSNAAPASGDRERGPSAPLRSLPLWSKGLTHNIPQVSGHLLYRYGASAALAWINRS